MIPQVRETLISVGLLLALLVVCTSVIGFSLLVRLDAVHALDARSALLARLETHSRARKEAGLSSGGVAPVAALLAAPTEGLAGAQLEAYLQHAADAQHAVLDSSDIEPPAQDDQPGSIRMQAKLEASVRSLQALLYQLESGTPYVFVQSLDIALRDGDAQRPLEDPLLRVTLGLRAGWRPVSR